MQGRIATDQYELTGTDWSTCSRIARRYGRSFYLASRFLPAQRRQAVHAIYAWCRTADDIVDSASCPETARRELNDWRAQLDNPRHLISRAFAATRDTYDIPVQPALDLLDGVGSDLSPANFRTWADLRVYCHCVAGTVGLMVSPVLGCSEPWVLEKAAALGIAMQLTNILRDVAEDASMGRLYLPTAELEDYGCDPEAVLAGRPNGEFGEFMRFQIARAREIYADAQEGIPHLPPASRFTTLAASRFYSGILTEIEAMDCNVFRTRAQVSSARKVRSLPSITLSFVNMSRGVAV